MSNWFEALEERVRKFNEHVKNVKLLRWTNLWGDGHPKQFVSLKAGDLGPWLDLFIWQCFDN